jgi:hypothetical protein
MKAIWAHLNRRRSAFPDVPGLYLHDPQEVLDIDPIQATKEEHHRVPLPPISAHWH